MIRRIRTHLEGEQGLKDRPPATQLKLERRQGPLEEWIKSLHHQHQTCTDELNAVFKRYLSGARQYQIYEKTLRDAEIPGSGTHEQIRALGLTTSQGRRVATLVKAYYLHVTQGFSIEQVAAKEEEITDNDLRLARNKLHNSIAMGRTYYILQEAFTRGVFALLPEHFPKW